MKTLKNIIRNKPALWVAISSIFMIVCAVRMIDSGRCLKTGFAPYGIVSLELAWDKSHANEIRQEWSSGYCNGAVISFKKQNNADNDSMIVNKAQKNIILDYFFLIAYPLFFVVAVLLLDSRNTDSTQVSNISKIMIALALASGLLDAVENIFMSFFLQGKTDHSYLFALPATIKFLFVLVVIFFIIVSFVRSLVRK